MYNLCNRIRFQYPGQLLIKHQQYCTLANIRVRNLVFIPIHLCFTINQTGFGYCSAKIVNSIDSGLSIIKKSGINPGLLRNIWISTYFMGETFSIIIPFAETESVGLLWAGNWLKKSLYEFPIMVYPPLLRS